MFEIKKDEKGTIHLAGRLDASQVEKARTVFDRIETSCLLDLEGLEYISSAGLGCLIQAQKRLGESEETLRLTGLQGNIREIFRISGLDRVIPVE